MRASRISAFRNACPSGLPVGVSPNAGGSSGTAELESMLQMPGLQHQHRPKEVLGIVAAIEVGLPQEADRRRTKQSGRFKAAFAEQAFRPLTQRPTQPVANGNAEAHLRPVEQPFRHMAV